MPAVDAPGVRVGGANFMNLTLDSDQHEALRELVTHAVADLSPEIAATDNWEYRAMLRSRRDRLREISAQLEAEQHRTPS